MLKIDTTFTLNIKSATINTLSMILKFIFINFERFWEQVMSIHVILWNTNYMYTLNATILTVLLTLLTDFLLIHISEKLAPSPFRIKEFGQFKKILT